MAITYNIAKCNDGYGIYMRAISGQELKALAFRVPEITITDKNIILLNGLPLKGAMAVISDRISRKKTIEQANKALKKLKALPFERQIEICKKRFFKPVEKDFKIAKLQYTRLSWQHGNKWITPFTTQNIVQAEKLAMDYAQNGTKAKLTKTVGKNQKLSHTDYDKATLNGSLKKETAKGLRGMCKDIKDQGPEMLNRISQRRKRTTTNQFFQKYR